MAGPGRPGTAVGPGPARISDSAQASRRWPVRQRPPRAGRRCRPSAGSPPRRIDPSRQIRSLLSLQPDVAGPGGQDGGRGPATTTTRTVHRAPDDGSHGTPRARQVSGGSRAASSLGAGTLRGESCGRRWRPPPAVFENRGGGPRRVGPAAGGYLACASAPPPPRACRSSLDPTGAGAGGEETAAGGRQRWPVRVRALRPLVQPLPRAAAAHAGAGARDHSTAAFPVQSASL